MKTTHSARSRVRPNADLVLVLLFVTLGCEPAPDANLRPTLAAVRATRRAYDGAPPVIPHPPLHGACTKCHAATGQPVPGYGLAPANPHLGTRDAAATANCRQCHVFAETKETFAESSFIGRAVSLATRGERAFPGAPPTIPHEVTLRANCRACHSDPAGRPELRCSHPERENCRQCHVVQ